MRREENASEFSTTRCNCHDKKVITISEIKQARCCSRLKVIEWGGGAKHSTQTFNKKVYRGFRLLTRSSSVSFVSYCSLMQCFWKHTRKFTEHRVYFECKCSWVVLKFLFRVTKNSDYSSVFTSLCAQRKKDTGSFRNKWSVNFDARQICVMKKRHETSFNFITYMQLLAWKFYNNNNNNNSNYNELYLSGHKRELQHGKRILIKTKQSKSNNNIQGSKQLVQP